MIEKSQMKQIAHKTFIFITGDGVCSHVLQKAVGFFVFKNFTRVTGC